MNAFSVSAFVTIDAMSEFPLGLENLEKWEGIFQSGKSSGNFEQTGKVGRKSAKITQNTGNFRQILFVTF